MKISNYKEFIENALRSGNFEHFEYVSNLGFDAWKNDLDFFERLLVIAANSGYIDITKKLLNELNDMMRKGKCTLREYRSVLY